MESQLSQKKLWHSWSIYDWANSSYNLVITSTIFPFYYVAITANVDTKDSVSFFGWEVINTALLNYALAFAYICVAFLIPILSSIADYTGNKKRFMKLFCYSGATACCLLFFFDRGQIEFGILMTIVAAIGWCGSLVFYNAYLPEIAAEKDRDKLSARGYGYGYVGSVLLQLICLIFVFALPEGTFAARISFLLVGLWWLLFAQIPFRNLPVGTPLRKDLQHSILSNGFIELKKVWVQIKLMPELKAFLTAFFFYSIGVQTVMLASGLFVMKEITREVDGKEMPLGEGDLIITVLIIQLVAIAGAALMARLSNRIGNIRVLILTVTIWIGICISAYYIHTQYDFYIIATVIGFVMGGVQSMSRSTYSKIMPPTRDTASFFSFYDVTEKVSMAIGLFTFGFMEHLTGNMRNSIFALAGFFLIGLVFLGVVDRMQKKDRLSGTPVLS